MNTLSFRQKPVCQPCANAQTLLELPPNSDFAIALDLPNDEDTAIIPNKDEVFAQAKENAS